MPKTQFETEGWKDQGRGRCLCPWCNVEVKSNAYARAMHKKACPKYGKSAPAPEKATPPASETVKSSICNSLSPPQEIWTMEKVAGTEEYRANKVIPTATKEAWKFEVPLRVRRLGMKATPSYSCYWGNTYVGAFPTVEQAQSAAENHVPR